SYQLLEVEKVDQLPAGLYFLSITFDNQERVVQKFIKE
ncbi:MAG: T9SS type A sorting domain-containing protein, partial [Aureispira sp.]|nr:T9SS type A sorting domain-containing protein [Aureispira sp.]